MDRDAITTVHPVSLATVDGLTLDGDLDLPAEPWAAAVGAPPPPRFGGDRHSPVVDALFRRLAAAGAAVVRFGFRGVGESQGALERVADEVLGFVRSLVVR